MHAATKPSRAFLLFSKFECVQIFLNLKALKTLLGGSFQSNQSKPSCCL